MNSRDKMGGACNMSVEVINAYGILVGNFDGERLLSRPRSRWEVNSKMGFQEIGSPGVD
jgi:hypothetical protein